MQWCFWECVFYEEWSFSAAWNGYQEIWPKSQCSVTFKTNIWELLKLFWRPASVFWHVCGFCFWMKKPWASVMVSCQNLYRGSLGLFLAVEDQVGFQVWLCPKPLGGANPAGRAPCPGSRWQTKELKRIKECVKCSQDPCSSAVVTPFSETVTLRAVLVCSIGSGGLGINLRLFGPTFLLNQKLKRNGRSVSWQSSN